MIIQRIKQLLFTLIQITWGSIQTGVGLVIFLLHIRQPHTFYHGAVVTPWHHAGSISLGLFIFVTDQPHTDGLLAHEYGHCLQSLLLGPFYLLVIGLPSFLWANLSVFKNYRRQTKRSYYSFYTERWANILINTVYHEHLPTER